MIQTEHLVYQAVSSNMYKITDWMSEGEEEDEWAAIILADSGLVDRPT